MPPATPHSPALPSPDSADRGPASALIAGLPAAWRTSPWAPGTRRITLVDCDAFFVSTARLADPVGLGDYPYVLVGGNAGGRGVVASASYPCRAMGVKAGMPIMQALRLCPQARAVPVPMALCSAKHREIYAVLAEFAPLVESASIDEFYADLTDAAALTPALSPYELAHRIRRTVRERTGIAVSLGFATNKLVAKMSVERAKPRDGADGVCVIPPGREADFLATCQLADIPMVGPKFQERLAQIGMRAVTDALPYDIATLTQIFGPREGPWLHGRIRGIDSTPVQLPSAPKSVSRDDTFDRDVKDDEALWGNLAPLVLRAASEMREVGFQARTITVRIRDHDFTTRQRSRTLPQAIAADRVILHIARELFAELRAVRTDWVRLIGVTLSGFAEEDHAQMGLFDVAGAPPESPELETARDRQLTALADDIRARFGRPLLVPGIAVSPPPKPLHSTRHRRTDAEDD